MVQPPFWGLKSFSFLCHLLLIWVENVNIINSDVGAVCSSILSLVSPARAYTSADKTAASSTTMRLAGLATVYATLFILTGGNPSVLVRKFAQPAAKNNHMR
jgi:hypothetical protein